MGGVAAPFVAPLLLLGIQKAGIVPDADGRLATRNRSGIGVNRIL